MCPTSPRSERSVVLSCFFVTSVRLVNTRYAAGVTGNCCHNASVILCQGILLIKAWNTENNFFFLFCSCAMGSMDLFRYLCVQTNTRRVCSACVLRPVKAGCRRRGSRLKHGTTEGGCGRGGCFFFFLSLLPFYESNPMSKNVQSKPLENYKLCMQCRVNCTMHSSLRRHTAASAVCRQQRWGWAFLIRPVRGPI